MRHGPFYHVTQNEKDMCEVCYAQSQRKACPACQTIHYEPGYGCHCCDYLVNELASEPARNAPKM